MKPIPLLLLLAFAALPACRSTAGAAQKFAEPYSVEASVTIRDGAGAEVRKGVWANSRFVALDFDLITGQVVVYGPKVFGGPIEELIRFTAGTGEKGRRVWELVVPVSQGEPVKFVPSTWEAARASIPSMPG